MAKRRERDQEFYYPFYPFAYQADTAHLSLEADAIYRRLIDWMMMWRQPLRDNDAAIASLARISPEKWAEHRDDIRAFFTVEDGYLVQKRSQATLEYLDTAGVSRVTKARLGWANRKAGLANENNDNLPRQNRLGVTKAHQGIDQGGTGVGYKEKEKEKVKDISPGKADEARQGDLLPDRFEDFWSAMPKRGRDLHNPKGAAQSKFRSLVRSGINPDDLVRAARGYASTRQGEPGRYTLMAETFLNKDRWREYLPLAPAQGPEEVDWNIRLIIGRERKAWPEEWGPKPGEENSLVPADLIQPGDGDGWGAWENGQT